MRTTGHRPDMEEPAMNLYLFLKADWNGRKNAPGRTLPNAGPNAGIDPVLLLLLSVRYV